MKFGLWQDRNSEIRIFPVDYISDSRFIFIGYEEISIQEPKKKKLVYQWVYERNNNIFDTTGEVFGINDRDIVRKYVSNFNAKEGGKLFPLMESEQEIDI